MKANAIRVLATLVLASTCAVASAEYRCNPAPAFVDQRACEAAQQGPDVLRRFVLRMEPIVNLSFADYVNVETLLRWEAKDAQARAVANQDSAGPVATNATR